MNVIATDIARKLVVVKSGSTYELLGMGDLLELSDAFDLILTAQGLTKDTFRASLPKRRDLGL